MRKLLLLICFCSIIVSSCTSNSAQIDGADSSSQVIDTIPTKYEAYQDVTPATSTKGGKEALLSEIRANEPRVMEAIITDANVLYISVRDDGSSRNGLADYFCQLVSEYSTSVKRVKIVKVNSTTSPDRDNAYGVLLGESWCN